LIKEDRKGPRRFDPHTIEYRYQNAQLLARASFLGYQSPDVIQAEVAQWGLPEFSIIDRKDTQAFWAGNAEMIIIAFRGTEPITLQDWMTDVKIRRKSGPYGKVHRGFLQGFQAG